eukprot:SAG11_NODE_35091_length_268_cov_0.923077_1_plen_44_part_10
MKLSDLGRGNATMEKSGTVPAVDKRQLVLRRSESLRTLGMVQSR